MCIDKHDKDKHEKYLKRKVIHSKKICFLLIKEEVLQVKEEEVHEKIRRGEK